jgi:4-amino-4-deoxy-L-arabinose transferase-like glycosyltransferase
MQAVLQRIFGFMPDWIVGLGLIALAILCALLVYRMARAVVRRAIGLQNSLAL